MEYVASVEDFFDIIFKDPESRNGEVLIGIDPAIRTLGVFAMYKHYYCCFTEDVSYLSPSKVLEGQSSAVRCGVMVGKAFTKDSKIDYLSTLFLSVNMLRARVAIEDVTRVDASNNGNGTIPSASYWAAAYAAYFTTRGFEVLPMNVRTAKANMGLKVEGSNWANKKAALSLVKEKLGLKVQTNHEADAFIVFASCFFPRLSLGPFRRHCRDPIQTKKDIEDYLDRLISRLSTHQEDSSSSPSTSSSSSPPLPRLPRVNSLPAPSDSTTTSTTSVPIRIPTPWPEDNTDPRSPCIDFSRTPIPLSPPPPHYSPPLSSSNDFDL